MDTWFICTILPSRIVKQNCISKTLSFYGIIPFSLHPYSPLSATHVGPYLSGASIANKTLQKKIIYGKPIANCPGCSMVILWLYMAMDWGKMQARAGGVARFYFFAAVWAHFSLRGREKERLYFDSSIHL